MTTWEIIKDIFAVIGFCWTLYGILVAVKRELNRRKAIVSWKQVEDGSDRLVQQIAIARYDPDLIVSIGKGGSIAGGIIASVLNIAPRIHIERRENPTVILKLCQGKLELQGKKILIVNGESNSGFTLREATRIIEEHNPSEIKTAGLIVLDDKNNKTQVEILQKPDYCGILVNKVPQPPWKRLA